jgi:hypothetical protein
MSNLKLKQLVNENLDGLVEFVSNVVTHQGHLDTYRLHKVYYKNDKYSVELATKEEKLNDYSLGIGGEIANSFTTLYESAYFFRAIFLSAIGSYLIRNNTIEHYQDLLETEMNIKIKKELLELTEREIFENLQNPLIAITCSLDTDIAPVRYNKHHLWRLKPEVFTWRVGQINQTHYNQTVLDRSFENKYWVVKDIEIANKAMQSGQNLLRCKSIQFYLVFEKLCKEIGIEIANVPLYFNYLPKEEIVNNGIDNSYLDILLMVHSNDFRNTFRQITGISKPWFICKSCPNCGTGSKRVISSKLSKDGSTVKSKCQIHEYKVKDENQNALFLSGCGHQYEYKIPTNKIDLYNFIKDNNIGIHFSIRLLICLLKDTVDTPIGYVVGDIGIIKPDKTLQKKPEIINGYGDHLQMLTSAIATQNWLINSNSELVNNLKHDHLLMPRSLFLYGNNQKATLTDSEIKCSNNSTTFVSDTSILKQTQKGRSVKEMFYLANQNLEVYDNQKFQVIKHDQLLKHSELTY